MSPPEVFTVWWTSAYYPLRSVGEFWGTPANFIGFRVLAPLLYGTLVVGVSQTLRRWTVGTSYIGQGGHHVGHWPTFLVRIEVWDPGCRYRRAHRARWMLTVWGLAYNSLCHWNCSSFSFQVSRVVTHLRWSKNQVAECLVFKTLWACVKKGPITSPNVDRFSKFFH